MIGYLLKHSHGNQFSVMIRTIYLHLRGHILWRQL
nr:MAG TPA: hypothetical protein [Caudoviricetes sp.]